MQIKSFLAAGAIAFGVITIGAGGAVAGSLIDGGDVVNGSLSGADVRNESITTYDIDNGTVTGADIRNESVTGTDIDNGTIGSADLSFGAIDYIEKQVNGVASVVNRVDLVGGELVDVTEMGVVTMTANVAAGGGDALVYLEHPTNGMRALECVVVATEFGGSCSATGTLPSLGYALRVEGGPVTVDIVGVKVGE